MEYYAFPQNGKAGLIGKEVKNLASGLSLSITL